LVALLQKTETTKKDKCEHIIGKTGSRCKISQFEKSGFCKKHAHLHISDVKMNELGLEFPKREKKEETETTCAYVITRGKNKGQNCSGKPKYDGFCSKHRQDSEDESEVEKVEKKHKKKHHKHSHSRSKSPSPTVIPADE
jgi:hypothetical protein